MSAAADLCAHLLHRLRRVQEDLGTEVRAEDPAICFADAVDSMGLVEFVALIAEDCGVTPEAVEQAAGHRFGTVAELAAALDAAGLHLDRDTRPPPSTQVQQTPGPAREAPTAWLAATASAFPAVYQPAGIVDNLLGRPPGWFERHTGIRQRCTWGDEDPVEVAARAARDCLDQAGGPAAKVGVLLVTSEVPPLGVGLEAALHHRLGLGPEAVVLEVGGACTGFLAALWLARRLLPGAARVLVVAVEAPSFWLPVRPGPAGEAAALFGDGAAACLLCAHPAGPGAVPLIDVVLGADGSAGDLIQVRQSRGGMELSMEGPALAGRAVGTMARAVQNLLGEHGLKVGQLEAVVVHGGNGRLPRLLARQLGLAADKVWSQTAQTGNLGSASLPAAWVGQGAVASGPVVWTAVGAGLTWGAALLGYRPPEPVG